MGAFGFSLGPQRFDVLADELMEDSIFGSPALVADVRTCGGRGAIACHAPDKQPPLVPKSASCRFKALEALVLR